MTCTALEEPNKGNNPPRDAHPGWRFLFDSNLIQNNESCTEHYTCSIGNAVVREPLVGYLKQKHKTILETILSIV